MYSHRTTTSPTHAVQMIAPPYGMPSALYSAHAISAPITIAIWLIRSMRWIRAARCIDFRVYRSLTFGATSAPGSRNPSRHVASIVFLIENPPEAVFDPVDAHADVVR